MKSFLSEKQHDYCVKQANELAKIIMDKDISEMFGDEGNANFCLETSVILSAGIITLVSKMVHLDQYQLLDLFSMRVNDYLDNNPKQKLTVVL
jgi:hypothetical protein